MLPARIRAWHWLAWLAPVVLASAQEPAPASALMSHPPTANQLSTQGLAPTPQAIYSRERIDLSGTWRFLVDPMERGLGGQYPRYTLAKDEKQPAVGGALVEYDWDSAPEISVPGDWNTQSNPRLFWYEGLGWYRRHFARPASVASDRRVFLYFEAANYRSHVYLNGELLGVHEGGFTPFAFEVTGKLKEDNSLVVGVNSRRQAGNVPGSDADWFNYGGITRPVWLVVTPATFIRRYSVALQVRDGREVVGMVAQLDGPNAGGTPVTVRVPELKIDVSAAADANGCAMLEFTPAALTRWSPENPKRYAFSVAIAGDQLDDRVGLRTIATRGAEILLNGASVYLRGISIHEERLGEHTDDGGRKLDWDDARRLLVEAKALGCNFVRLAHYPHTDKMTRLADELGLLVWSEIPVYQDDIPYTDAHALEVARRMLEANIARDCNRASIIVWSVANETPLTAPRLAFLRTLIATARAADPTRLISAALNRSLSSSRLETVLDDPLGADLDLLAYNTYAGWYGDLTPADIPAMKWRTIYDKPMILSELGADAKSGVHGPKESRWTEEYQAWFYAQTLANATTVPWIRGMSPWILKDFRSPRRFRADYQNYWNRKGLLSETGERKLAWSVLHEFYARR